MKKLSFVLLLVLCVICMAAALGETSGDYTYVVLEDGTAQITDYACFSTSELTIPEKLDGYVVTSIGNWVFIYRSSLTSVTIPDGVTSIGDEVFHGCSKLSTVTIPDSVVSIGTNPFEGCDSLTSVLVSVDHPALAVIDGALFSKPDKRLVWYPRSSASPAYTIPQGIQIIGDYAFYRCTNLTSVTIPDSVTSIGNTAFYWCSGLTSVTIPDSVVSIGANPFFYCTSLTSIVVSPDHPALAVIDGVLFSKPDKRLVCCPMSIAPSFYTIPQGIQIIGDSAFSECTGLTSVTIPDSVISIGNCSFSECTGLTDVTIPDSVTFIGNSAFCECTSLTGVTIPNSVTYIDSAAFYYCTSLTSVTIPDSVTFIGDNAFDKCSSQLCVTVGRDSYAAQYCKDNNLQYTYTDSLDWLNN